MTKDEAMKLALEALESYHESDTMEQECNPHPDAPHGFNRDASHGLGRYVCDCEGWEPPTVSQEPQTMPEKTDDVAQETQPEQKPVAWRYKICPPHWTYSDRLPNKEFAGDAWDRWQVTPLYTAPPKREFIGLTDEEIEYLDMETSGTVHDFVHAIEAKLKEKNHA